jgi:cytochrome c553
MPAMIHCTRGFRPLVWTACLSAMVSCQATRSAEPSPEVDSVASQRDARFATLEADVQTLKDKSVSASVAMADVGFHWANLWFAGESQNWPLANYYYSEARNHVAWLTRITPTPKGPDGNLVELKPIFDAIDTTAFAAVKGALANKDRQAFRSAYREALVACYSCHKAVGRPYLRLQIPTTAPQSIVNLDPKATWPE